MTNCQFTKKLTFHYLLRYFFYCKKSNINTRQDIYEVIVNKPCEKLVDALIEETIAIQQIPSPTFEENERAAYVEKRFLDQGYEQVVMDSCCNVYGRIAGGKNRPVVVSAHLDTVFEKTCDLSIQKTKDRIYGPGIGDNSLGVACLVMMKQILDSLDAIPAGDIILAANACEEGTGDLKGMKAVFSETIRHDPIAYIALEGTSGARVIYTKGIGSKRYRITARGQGGHSWNDFGNSSAIHAIVRLGAELTRLKPSKTPVSTFNIGVISGGRSVNTIAQEASLLLDLRSESQTGLKDLTDQTLAILDSFYMPDIAVTHELIGDRPSGAAPEDSGLIKLCRDVFIETGFHPVEMKAGSTDANIPFSKGVSAVCIGIADGEDAHKESECLIINNLDKSIEKVGKIISRVWL